MPDIELLKAASKWAAEKADELAQAETSGDLLTCALLVEELTAYPRTIKGAKAKGEADLAEAAAAAEAVAIAEAVVEQRREEVLQL